MNEEEVFDHEIKNKIDSLDQVPDLNWDENKVWDKLEPELLRPSFILLLFPSILLVMILAWFYLPGLKNAFFHNKKEVQLTNQPSSPVTRATQMQIMTNDTVVEDLKVVGDKLTKLPVVKKGHQKVADRDVPEYRRGKAPLSIVLPNALTEQKNDTPETMSFNFLVDSSAEETLLPEITELPANNDSLQTVRSPFEEDKDKQASVLMETQAIPHIPAFELELSAQNAGYQIGVNKSYAITPRLSLVYGLGINRYISKQTSLLERATSAVLQTDFHVQLMTRYYFTPPENKFQGFVYGGLHNSWTLNQPDYEKSSMLNFKSGLEIRYKYFESNNGRSASYFFLRLPLYQKNISTENNFFAPYNPQPYR